MAAPLKNQNAKGNNGGNPGYGKLSFITKNANKILPEWWKIAKKWLKDKDPKLQQVAFQELNKIQVKMIPQTLSNDPTNPLPNIGVIILPQKDANTLETNTKTK